ncbi:hypothetical protein [Mesorhizobium sp.]|nr:hypothetical protein [Mesorhizobium sp.]
MGKLDRIINGMAYGFGGVIGVGLACVAVTSLAVPLRAAIQYLAPLF